MRETKFRLWDRFEQRYLNISELQSCYISPVDGCILFLDGYDTDARYYKEQYTGLKDQNGKEIYEGDIIKTGLNELAVIEYNCDLLAYIAKEVGYEQYDIEGRDQRENDTLEVIGNVYENPELLNETNK